jgi:hypothetical protein
MMLLAGKVPPMETTLLNLGIMLRWNERSQTHTKLKLAITNMTPCFGTNSGKPKPLLNNFTFFGESYTMPFL